MTREELIVAIVEATARDVLVVPKDKYEMGKLAKRRMAGHVGHGALRYVAGSAVGVHPVVGLATGAANVARYVEKVQKAKEGKHRQQKKYKKRGAWA